MTTAELKALVLEHQRLRPLNPHIAYLDEEMCAAILALIDKAGLSICCDGCGMELNERGALAFSPPDEYGRTDKYHLCVNCWPRLQIIVARKGRSPT